MAGEHLWLRVANLVDEKWDNFQDSHLYQLPLPATRPEGEFTITPAEAKIDVSRLLCMDVDIEPLILEAWAERVKEAVRRDIEKILYGNLDPRSRVYLGVMRA